MKTIDIMAAIAEGIQRTVFGEWRHEGDIEGADNEQILVKIDGQEYVISIEERPTGAELLLEMYDKKGKKA